MSIDKSIDFFELNHHLSHLADSIRLDNAINGWDIAMPDDWHQSDYKIPAILGLIHSEVSEALEAFHADDIEAFNVEMADVLIRVLDCVGAFTDDFDSIVAAKLEKNRGRGWI